MKDRDSDQSLLDRFQKNLEYKVFERKILIEFFSGKNHLICFKIMKKHLKYLLEIGFERIIICLTQQSKRKLVKKYIMFHV